MIDTGMIGKKSNSSFFLKNAEKVRIFVLKTFCVALKVSIKHSTLKAYCVYLRPNLLHYGHFNTNSSHIINILL